LKVRFVFFRLVVLVAFAILTVRLWQLQIVERDQYRLRADRNRFRLVPIDAPRGVMYDRSGKLLVRNEPSFTVTIVPADLPEDAEDLVFERLAGLLDMPASNATALASAPALSPVGKGPGPALSEAEGVRAAGIRELVEAGRATPFTPVPIKSRVSREIAFIVEEEHLNLPGVRVEIEPIRHYLPAALTSHLLGYLGRIPAERADFYLNQPDADYEVYDRVGQVGLEYAYEQEMRGKKGLKHVEVDALGREVRTVGDLVPPTPGYNLLLSLDLSLQEAAEAALKRGMERVKSDSGVVIAMNPQTGEILAMVSLPTYDNNLFAGGIAPDDYQQLATDPNLPLFNRAISGEYPVGSTFKIIPAAAALQEGVLTRKTIIVDPGAIWVPNKYAPDDPSLAQPFVCWKKSGHGPINVVEGLAQSCDVFFYEVSGGYKEFQGLGAKRLAEYAHAFGFGEPTGIPLPGEGQGLVPDDRWKRQTWGEVWVTGDTYNMAIGQGFFLATPLQLLNATAAIANGGTLYRPQLVHQVVDAEGKVVRDFTPEVIRRVPVDPVNLAIVREGMRGAVTHGTAYWAGLPTQVPIAGKTGTAEFFVDRNKDGQPDRDKEGNLPTHAWFTAFAPYDDPKVALVVFVSGGGEGSAVAAPIAAEILRAYFGLPLPQIQPTPVNAGD
jgi:penicillin-binding protein 2